MTINSHDIQKTIERTFPDYIVDAYVEQSTRKVKLSVYNAHRYSNTRDSQREHYYLDDFASEHDLLDKIKQDFI